MYNLFSKYRLAIELFTIYYSHLISLPTFRDTSNILALTVLLAGLLKIFYGSSTMFRRKTINILGNYNYIVFSLFFPILSFIKI